MRTDDLAFDLPAELIAQTPSPERAASRLLHYRRADKTIAHRRFAELPSLLRRDDVLVFNDAKVIPARFMLRKETGGRVEGLFLRQLDATRWLVMLRNLGRHTGPLHFEAEPGVGVSMIRADEGGQYEIEVASAEPALALLERVGRMPLPPYIHRDKDHDDRDEADRSRYQTVYAKTPGSVAAPTAGLHFTDEVLREIDAVGVTRVSVTLHVGMGTFKPVTANALEDHVMHTESYAIDAAAAGALNAAQSDGRRIVAVGTTSARVLESWPEDEPWTPATGETDIFIRPPYRWRRVGAMVTNFHLPRSTLVALVAALVGIEEQRRIYATAIAERYRFFSYGDAMFVE